MRRSKMEGIIKLSNSGVICIFHRYRCKGRRAILIVSSVAPGLVVAVDSTIGWCCALGLVIAI
jgi:hypothetical protein